MKGPLIAVPIIKSSNFSSPRLARHAPNPVAAVAGAVVSVAAGVPSVAVVAMEQPRVARVVSDH
jgi:hypothetical protein